MSSFFILFYSICWTPVIHFLFLSLYSELKLNVVCAEPDMRIEFGLHHVAHQGQVSVSHSTLECLDLNVNLPK